MKRVWGGFSIPRPRPTSALGQSFFPSLLRVPIPPHPNFFFLYIYIYIYNLLKVYFKHNKLKLIKLFF